MSSRLRIFLLTGPLIVFLTMCYLLPFLGIIGWSVTLPEPGLGQYEAALSDPLVHSVAWRTLRICVLVTVFSVVAAYAISLVWVRGSPMQRLLVELCILIPFWISVLTRAFGWLALLSNRGIINSFLKDIGLIDASLTMVRNDIGVIIGMMHFLIPFAVFPLASAMRAVDERALMAARGMGAGRARIFWQIFVPMTANGIIGACLIVFVFALGFFVTPAILGGGRSVMIAELIYLRIFQSPNWGLAAAISVLMMLAVGMFLSALMRHLAPRADR